MITDEIVCREEIVNSRVDGGRNIVHAALMNAFATKNSLEADVDIPSIDNDPLGMGVLSLLSLSLPLYRHPFGC